MKVDYVREVAKDLFLLLALLPLIVTGCATRQQAVDLEASVAELQVSNEEISDEIKSLRDLVLAEHELIMSTKADVLAEISGLKEQIYMMENRLTEKDEELFFEFGEEVEEGEIGTALMPERAEEAGTVIEGEIPQSPEAGRMDERVMYDTAFLDMTRGRYELAIEGFQSFIESSDNSQLLDNAQYWIGECHYALGDLRKAIEEFEKVIDNYPRGNKIPSALFKIGKCYFELGDRDAARRYFKSVVDGYPRSEEANLSNGYLSEL
jgi:tol-pal system protein YbgF